MVRRRAWTALVISVAFDLRDPQRSGIARVATATLQAFLAHAADGFRVFVAGPPRALTELGVRRWGDVHIVPFEAGRYSPRAELEWPHVARMVGEAVWLFPHFDVPWRSGRTRHVAVVHDVAHFEGPEPSALRGAIARQWIRRTISRARRIHAPSRFTAERLRALWPEESAKIAVVPNGIGEDFFLPPTPLPPRWANLLRRDPFMLSVGNRKRHKNLSVGVDVLRNIPGLRWVIVGERFHDWEVVEDRARSAGVRDRMIVSEREDDDALRALYHESACLLFPSLYEGFGLPLLEAMACGTPVVASATTSIPEVVGDCGWLCQPHAAGEFADAVRAVLALGADRDRVVQKARSRARAFSWQRAAEAFANAARGIDAGTA